MSDYISRQAAIDVLKGLPTWWADEGGYYGGAQPPMVALLDPEDAVSAIENLPSAHPEQLSDAYTKAVWTWLLDYQIKAAELKGRYTPYEVLSWVANDWRKEHEGSD